MILWGEYTCDHAFRSCVSLGECCFLFLLLVPDQPFRPERGSVDTGSVAHTMEFSVLQLACDVGHLRGLKSVFEIKINYSDFYPPLAAQIQESKAVTRIA